MSNPTESEAKIKKWTKEDVHQWLKTQVNIPHSCADKLLEEEVSGEDLLYFQKQDLLDMEVKHGPAIKILAYLEELKRGSRQSSKYPAYVEKWTKEQVYYWLLDKLNVYKKYADILLKEEVSGDCLVCINKKDLTDLEIKHGPAVKMLAKLSELNSEPELEIQTPTHIKADTEKQQKHHCNSHAHLQTPSAQTAPPTEKRTEGNPDESGVTESSKKSAQKNREPKAHAIGPERTTLNKVSETSPRMLIQKYLEELRKNEFKKLLFFLHDSELTKGSPIPQSCLEDKDCTDIADLMIKTFSNDALNVTLRILEKIPCKDLVQHLKCDMEKLKKPNPKASLRREANQGDKLKNLLTCGGNFLDHYDQFVIVMNKSHTEQLEHFLFLSKLKLFCVLDFDPNSAAPGGVCSFYRELRAANLHVPAQFQSDPCDVINNLNLYKQTSWVFCKGRNDLNCGAAKEMDYKEWLRTVRKDIEHMISFICKPEVLQLGKTLIIFLLLSPVHTDRDPVFDTFISFYTHVEENIVSICESQSTFEKWRDLIQSKCDWDITNNAIYELTLSEINGTVMTLGPHTQTSGRHLPCLDSSTVVLKQKDEDYMSALDILCENQCQNVYDEKSTEFQHHKINVEEEFYRGGKVKWWNFYFCDQDKNKSFIKRDKYDNVMKMVKDQTKSPRTTCVLLNLFHHPGCGGTTLAMHVMWDLRREFRCAVLKDNTLPKPEVARQITMLMKLGQGEKSTPVLLLVDDSKGVENTHNLMNCICNAVNEECPSTEEKVSPNPLVIILSCVRSPYPKDQYKRYTTNNQFITNSLTKKEQDEFEKKLHELKEDHAKPENFYSFMIMKSNFDEKYIAGLVSNTLEDFNIVTKQAKLFAYLGVLNTYVAGSHISESLCRDFLGMKFVHWGKDSVLDRMEPYSNLLIIDDIEDRGRYKVLRILHQSIASACLEELSTHYNIELSEISMDMLQTDLLFKTGVVKDTLMSSIQRMLIERQRKKDGDERETQFSPLIEKIHNQEGRVPVQNIFEKASSRFVESVSIPQALARYLCIHASDFQEALRWAENAKTITENPFIVDTIGQVYKSMLKCNIQAEMQKIQSPDDLNTNLKLAKNAMKAFQRAQDLTKYKDEPEHESEETSTKQSYDITGYIGVMEIIVIVFEILCRLPFFKEGDSIKKKYLQSFLKNTIPITSVPDTGNEEYRGYIPVIKEHERFLHDLITKVKGIFEIVDGYFTFIKGRNLDDFESKNRRKMSDHFSKYLSLICPSSEEMRMEREKKSQLNLNIDIEESKMYLEERHANTFVGILKHLDKDAKEIEKITECYVMLNQHSKLSDKKSINLILSCVILHILKPKSKHLMCLRELILLLEKILQNVGLLHPFPDPYFLALLLYWPSTVDTGDKKNEKDIQKYVNSIRKSSQKHLYILYRKRSTVAHFYLGKQEGLKRLVPKPKLDECFKSISRNSLAQLWRTGEVFKEKKIIDNLCRVHGTIELGDVSAYYGNLKIPVRPAKPGAIQSGYSTEKVSFYIGFAIDGPLAYDIKYEN